MLAEVCPGVDSGGRAGCAGCAPDFRPSSARPAAFSDVVRLVEGAFTGPERSEVLVTFAACDEQTSEHSILLRRESGRFQRLDALPRTGLGRCAASPPSDGYSRLACQGATSPAHAAQGGADVWLDVLDLRLRRSERVISVRNTERAACGDGERAWLRSFGVTAIAFRDLDGDGDDDLWLRALWAFGPEPRDYDAHCRDLFSPPDDWMAVARQERELRCELPETQCGALEFLTQDGALRPSAATARRLAELDAAQATAPASW